MVIVRGAIKKKSHKLWKSPKGGWWVSGIIKIVYISKYRLFCMRGGRSRFLDFSQLEIIEMWVGGGGGVPILVISLKIKLTLIKKTLFVKCSPKTNAKPYNGKQL